MATTLLACAIILLVLFGPIFIGAIERNLEVFFLAIGFVTAWMMGELKGALVHDVLVEPLSFTLAVLIFGSAFRLGRSYLDRQLARLILVVEPSRICFGLTLLLSALAPFITPVVSALVFVEAIALLRLDRAGRIAVTVLGCFSIGLAAGLTPLGMPGIAVVLRSLQAGFWYLTRLVGPFVAAGSVVVAIPILSLDLKSATRQEAIEPPDPWCVVLLTRPGKIYLFIGGLVALSEGLRPVVDAYVVHFPRGLLFWMNAISAVVNNSTLAAIEIGPTLSLGQQRAAFLGLLISGGILVTGNIPNVVAAGRLGITSREWARIGILTGLPLMAVCFVLLRWIA